MGLEGSLQDLTSFSHHAKPNFFGKLVHNLKQTKNEGYTTSINAILAT